ncbi:glycosyltransferase family 4 protein [Thermotoga profunda]|uniref:glycosyltransferase family 4 protein n=1 Tax=Thermotoga profunda TaxID=1508420 RepID=UPI000597A75B|nr:glycosyltransferase family 4 protein [Thermotoga profunda]
MRIAILNHYASIPQMGSSETRHFELAKRFAKDGHTVDIYVGEYSHLNREKWTNVYKEDFQIQDIEFFVVKTREYRSNSLSRFLSSYDYFKNGKEKIIKNEYDIVISSSPHPFSWSLGWYYCKRKKAKFIIEIRDVWPDDLVSLKMMNYSHPVARFFSYMCKKYYPKAHQIISLVPDLSQHFNRLGLKDREIQYIPNGVDFEIFQNPTPSTDVDEIFSKLPSGIKVVYAGSIVPHNGVKEFLELLNQVDQTVARKFVFIFVGPAQKEYLLQIKAMAKDNVFFFNPITKTSIPYLFSKSDVLLFTLSETQMNNPAVSSYKVLDYMASGKPILSVDIDGLLFKSTDGAVFYKNNDHMSLQTALEKISSQDLSESVKRNVQYIVQERTWDTLYEKFKNIIFS